MPLADIRRYATNFIGLYYASVKHTQKWYCAFCDASHISLLAGSWTLSSPPRVLVYYHFVFNPGSEHMHELRTVQLSIAQETGSPPPPRPPPLQDDPLDFPPMGACAGCEREETADMPTMKCSACNLTRYCSKACQKEHWPEHKFFCKVPKSVKWV